MAGIIKDTGQCRLSVKNSTASLISTKTNKTKRLKLSRSQLNARQYFVYKSRILQRLQFQPRRKEQNGGNYQEVNARNYFGHKSRILQRLQFQLKRVE